MSKFRLSMFATISTKVPRSGRRSKTTSTNAKPSHNIAFDHHQNVHIAKRSRINFHTHRLRPSSRAKLRIKHGNHAYVAQALLTHAICDIGFKDVAESWLTGMRGSRVMYLRTDDDPPTAPSQPRPALAFQDIAFLVSHLHPPKKPQISLMVGKSVRLYPGRASLLLLPLHISHPPVPSAPEKRQFSVQQFGDASRRCC
ncbi:hypothetical protein B0O99DRAFT_606163 [Bisporella sp. PMI_857]|nr:hypothetical protein B0O99DRAFT_606163 [Bisporella sp. PMI_857]